jgi:hypothetical protein
MILIWFRGVVANQLQTVLQRDIGIERIRKLSTMTSASKKRTADALNDGDTSTMTNEKQAARGAVPPSKTKKQRQGEANWPDYFNDVPAISSTSIEFL